MRMVRSLICSTVALIGVVSHAMALEWMHDLDAAREKAATENKLLLVEFTGSDWCKHCLMQKKKVLENAEFERWVTRHCVPVEVDVPNDAARVGGEIQKKLNKLICDDYGVKSFPTLRILTPELVDVGGYSGAQSNPRAAIARLEKSFPAAERLQRALRKTGEARTLALLEIYRNQPETARSRNFPMLKLVAESDPANISGLVPEFRAQQQMKQLERELLTVVDSAARIECVDRILEHAEPVNKPKLRQLRGQLMRELALQQARHAKTVAEIIAARHLMTQSLEFESEPAARLQLEHFIRVYFADPEAMLRQQKNSGS